MCSIAGFDSRLSEYRNHEAEICKSQYRRQRQTAPRASSRIMLENKIENRSRPWPPADAARVKNMKMPSGIYLFKA